MEKKPLAELMQNKFNKLVIVFIIFFLLILLSVGFSMYDYFYKSAKQDTYNNINYYFNNLDNTLNMVEEKYNQISRKELNNFYNRYKKDEMDMKKNIENLKKNFLKNSQTGYNIKIKNLNYYIIDKEGKIINTDYQKDMGLDLSNHNKFWNELSSLNSGEILLNSFDEESRTNNFRLYSYIKLSDGRIFELGISFANINHLIVDQLEILLSDKNNNIALFTSNFIPFFDNNIKLTDKEKKIFQRSIDKDKTIKEDTDIFSQSYYRGWSSQYGSRYIRVDLHYGLYATGFYLFITIFLLVIGFQLFLRYSFKNIIINVIDPITNLSSKMNNFDIKKKEKFNFSETNIEELNDIQTNFLEMVDEINASYEQLEAYNEEIVSKNENLNKINKQLKKSRKKYKLLFNNMWNAFAYYKIIYNDEMNPVDYRLLEVNRAFEDMFGYDETDLIDKKMSDVSSDLIVILFERIKKIIEKDEDQMQFEQYIPSVDRWFDINVFSTKKGYFATVISDITELKKSKQELEKLSSNLEKLISLTSALSNTEIGEKTFLKKLLDTVVEVIPEADYGTVYKNTDGITEFVSSIGHDNDKLKELSLSEDHFYNKKDSIEIIENTMEKNESKFSNDDLLLLKEGQKPIKETMTFDLIIDSQVMAGLNLDIRLDSNSKFSNNAKRIFKSFHNISTSFYKLQKYNILQNQFTKELILSIVRMLEIHDLYTRGHSEKVADIAQKIAEEMGLSDEKINDVYWSGMVHDIGKILIPDNILNKEGSLTDKEYEIIKKHPVWGYQTLISSKGLQDIARFVLFHHERWDGKGYPKGLKETEIPLISRILTVADAWDAMRTDRAYRTALPKKEAVEELIANKGSQFDSKVVEVFLENL